MCGLLGVYSNNFMSLEYDLFDKLLLMNVFRGEDSTGVVRVSEKGHSASKKSLLASPEFLATKDSDIIRDVKEYKDRVRFLLGHTRAATKGEVILKNAHPFSFSNVVGMHNGTIHSKFKHRDEYGTDSEALYRNINDYGIEEALKEVNEYDSAYALQFYDKKEKTLNFIRNKARPLHFTFLYSGQTLVWSSEHLVLEYLLKHKKQWDHAKGWDKDVKEKIFTLNPNDLYTIHIDSDPDEGSVTHLDIPEKKVSTKIWRGGGTMGSWVSTPYGHQYVPHEDKENLPIIYDQPKKGSSKSNITTNPDTAETDGKGYKKYKERYSRKGLADLPWLSDDTSNSDSGIRPFSPSSSNLDDSIRLKEIFGDDEHSFTGYQGKELTEKEMRHHMADGCFSCGGNYDLDNPHDFEGINSIRWFDQDTWACDVCYTSSDNDWVRHSIDDTWHEQTVNKGVKK